MIIFWRFCMFRNIFFINRMELNPSPLVTYTNSLCKGITFNIVIDLENK